MSLQAKIDSLKSTLSLLEQAGLSSEAESTKQQISKLEKELKGEKPSQEPPKKKTVVIKRKKPVIKKKAEEPTITPTPTAPKNVKVVKAKGRPLKETSAKAEVLRSLGASEAIVKKEREVVEVEKPTAPRGRPKKVDVKKLSGEELIKAVEQQAKISDLREQATREAYQARLEQRKQQRAEQAKPRGRPRKTQPTQPTTTPKPTPKPKSSQTELTSKDVKNQFSKYRFRVLDYSISDVKNADKNTEKAVENLLTEYIVSNSDISPSQLTDTYKRAKSMFNDIPKYNLWLDALLFSIYLYNNEVGKRITTTLKESRSRKDAKEMYPEYAQAFIKDDYNPKKTDFWTVFGYYRLKTGNWNKSFKMLSESSTT